MLNRLQHIGYTLVFCFLIASCQADKEASAPLPPTKKQAPIQVQTNQPQKVQEAIKAEIQETLPVVNLNLSKELLEKIDVSSRQELELKLQKNMENETTEQRKVKISGGVLVDQDETDLIKKMDGGKVNISVPFN